LLLTETDRVDTIFCRVSFSIALDGSLEDELEILR
jgi:hypothetical protein